MEKDLTQKGQFLRCLIRLGGGGLTPNETLSLSNGKFVFDHGPKGHTDDLWQEDLFAPNPP